MLHTLEFTCEYIFYTFSLTRLLLHHWYLLRSEVSGDSRPYPSCSFALYSRKISAIVKMDFSPKKSSSFRKCRSGLGFSSASSLNTLDCTPASLPSMTEQTIWLVDASMELEPFFFFLVLLQWLELLPLCVEPRVVKADLFVLFSILVGKLLLSLMLVKYTFFCRCLFTKLREFPL